ncbi:MAG: DUF192 domain-containing protein [Desulfobaccales bacterium]
MKRGRCRSLRFYFLVAGAAALLSVPAPGEELSEYGNPLTRLRIKGVQIIAEVVSTPDRLYLGLSHRPQLSEGMGMLFVMGQADRHSFCMRDMRFGIDIIWIAKGRVAALHKGLSPRDTGDFRPPVPVPLVLEVPAGFADRHGIKVGDRVEGDLPALSP